MADKLLVDRFTRRRFSKSTEQIKAKSLSLESFFKAQDGWNMFLLFVRTFAPKIKEQTFAYLNLKCCCVKMADKLLVDRFTRRRFSKSTEQIKAKSLSLESFFKEQDGWNICLLFVRTFVPKIQVQKCRAWKCRARVNGPESCRRPVVSLSHTTNSYRVNRPLLNYYLWVSFTLKVILPMAKIAQTAATESL